MPRKQRRKQPKPQRLECGCVVSTTPYGTQIRGYPCPTHEAEREQELKDLRIWRTTIDIIKLMLQAQFDPRRLYAILIINLVGMAIAGALVGLYKLLVYMGWIQSWY